MPQKLNHEEQASKYRALHAQSEYHKAVEGDRHNDAEEHALDYKRNVGDAIAKTKQQLRCFEQPGFYKSTDAAAKTQSRIEKDTLIYGLHNTEPGHRSGMLAT